MSLISSKTIKEFVFKCKFEPSYVAYLRITLNYDRTEASYYFINEPNGTRIEKPSFMAVESLISQKFLPGEGVYFMNQMDGIAFSIFGKLPHQLVLDHHKNKITIHHG